MPFRTITLEEHFMSSNALTAVPATYHPYYNAALPSWLAKLADLSPDGTRMQAMEAGGIGVQVLSNGYGMSSCKAVEVARSNDELAAATKAQARFRGFAALSMKEPATAAAELERCVRELGFVGALVDSHLDDGRYYDEECFGPVFEAAERLNVPIYIHPTTPTDKVRGALYSGNFPPEVDLVLGIAGWGWHCDTALAVLRMYGAGVFTKFPKLRVVVGHMGEMLPYMLDRIDEKMGQLWTGREASFREVWDRNVWVTTSGMFTLPPMACLLRSTKIDHIMYSVDYPYSDTEQGDAFLKELRESGLVSSEEFEMIAYKNAETLLKMKVDAL